MPSLSIAENIFLGDQVGKSKILPDFKEMYKRSVEIMEDLGIKINVGTQVGMLSIAQMQIVEIAKAIVKNCKVLIMDEPSASIPVAEVANMFRIVKQLKTKGVSVIYKLMNRLVEEGNSILMISSEMEELLGMSDRIMVLHEGTVTSELNKNEFSQDKILELASGIVED